MNQKQIFSFSEGHASMKSLLGGKGANLAEMARIGLPVPAGFTITTDACRIFFQKGERLTEDLWQQARGALADLEVATGQAFGDPGRPLLLSVRSGSVTSMPGMMDTILNLGLNDQTVKGFAASTNDPRFAYDCYRRLLQMFGHVVMGIPSHLFDRLLQELKNEEGVQQDQEVSAAGWEKLIGTFKACYVGQTGREFPQDVSEQLRLAVEAVFRSWNTSRAQIYRKINSIPDDQGTAVNVQSMVFGNKGNDSGTGVIFTRNPSTGERGLYGEYLINAQGEDVVAGVRTPQPIASLNHELPDIYKQLNDTAELLENHYRDMQDIEFTVEGGRLFLLQTRAGKRNAQASMKIAVDLVKEGVLRKEEALQRIEPGHLDQLLHRGIEEELVHGVIASGLPASPGAAVGQVVFDADMAEAWSREGKAVILVRSETTPEDIHGVLAAEGVLTSRGGMTSHAAVVARGMGKPCVCGCEAIHITAAEKYFEAGEIKVAEGDWITLDGGTGRVIAGIVPLREAEMTPELLQMLEWADEIRTMKVLANADNPKDAQAARMLGAEGVGLCRTEHMFLSPERLPLVREMILADSRETRDLALAKLLPLQRQDFEDIFRAMDGLPVTIRLLDPPLHEFLPQSSELQQKLHELSGDGPEAQQERHELRKLLAKVQHLHEANPMLGQRGCRLGIVYPEIYNMQIEAIFKAVLTCKTEGITVIPEIMVPLVGHDTELKLLRENIDKAAARIVEHEGQQNLSYKVGTMIEVPRAALTARKIAAYADFFSFGTNDLTQMTLGYSRDDAEGKFMSRYIDEKLLPYNPFQVLDTEGVGQLIEMAVLTGRAVRPALKTGICGEHGGDKASIAFCLRAGLDYVSCSPYRVPLARIAAAQAWLDIQRDDSQEKPEAV
ncbi:pyruvate, phosphate dikinase [Paenibacillus nasutitermitis]|uniref:Pyruvate, phosphate dikinase n=1 Tax=Paenibacillus nasutitermitis TaxID=1652958 RepID=A0A917DM46_9BACL|nr:pyruvate, phosphate dikinase [Paenibacillus nasutitermitis]GGD48637.1 pyruvate, phosphate dikinase [Paenibacillus nasutitermitis]